MLMCVMGFFIYISIAVIDLLRSLTRIFFLSFESGKGFAHDAEEKIFLSQQYGIKHHENIIEGCDQYEPCRNFNPKRSCFSNADQRENKPAYIYRRHTGKGEDQKYFYKAPVAFNAPAFF